MDLAKDWKEVEAYLKVEFGRGLVGKMAVMLVNHVVDKILSDDSGETVSRLSHFF